MQPLLPIPSPDDSESRLDFLSQDNSGHLSILNDSIEDAVTGVHVIDALQSLPPGSIPQEMGDAYPEAYYLSPESLKISNIPPKLDYHTMSGIQAIAMKPLPPYPPCSQYQPYTSIDEASSAVQHTVPIISTDRRASSSSSTSKISRMLRNLGRSPSEQSLIKRALKLRYSMSSMGSSVCKSLWSVSYTSNEQKTTSFLENRKIENARFHKHLDRANTHILLEQEEQIRSDNRDISELCCSQNQDCVHKRITHCMNNSVEPLEIPLGSNTYEVGGIENSVLFFAASVGAPLHVLLTLISHYRHKLNNIDVRGRTFMFYLDPRGISTSRCVCEKTPHRNSFSCLMMKLFWEGFEVEHVDYQGKRFIDWLSLSDNSQIQWVIDIMKNYPVLGFMFVQMARTTNPYGISFPDRLSSQDFEIFSRHGAGKLSNFSYYRNGRTQVHNLMSKTHMESSNGEESLLALVQHLHNEGANLDCQSDCGTTPLIFSAKKQCPQTTKFLLSLEVDVLAKDATGRSALDYTMIHFNSSRSSKAPASSLPRAILSFLHFADNKSNVSLMSESAHPNMTTRLLAERLGRRTKA